MKKLISAFLIITYCFAISCTVFPSDFNDFQGNPEKNTDVLLSLNKGIISQHTSQSESTLSNFNILPSPLSKNQWKEYWVVCNIHQQIFENFFFQYSIIARNFLTEHPKTDLIFPFHHFL
jgi:hypothetical protein